MARLWKRDNGQWKTDKLWVGFGLNPKNNPDHVARLVKSQFFPSVETSVLGGKSADGLPVSVALRIADFTNSDMLTECSHTGVGALPLFWLYQDSVRPHNLFVLPVNVQSDTVDCRNTGIVSSENILNKDVFHSGFTLHD